MTDIILVDKKDQQIGSCEKLEAHKKGLLHRAFSIFIFNDKHELLLQRRAVSKYHSPLLWTNTCCSHPTLKEQLIEAAHRRLGEEMGFTTDLTELFSFIYQANFTNGLIEHEFDHVFAGYYNHKPNFNTSEVQAVKYMSLDEISQDILIHPQVYSPWFKIIIENHGDKLEKWLTC